MTVFRTTLAVACAVATLSTVGHAQAQATVKDDGQWHSAGGLGASLSGGNSRSSNLAVRADAVRLTAQDKASLYGNASYAKSGSTTTGEQVRAGGRYDLNLGATSFAFGGLDLDHNKFANLSLRGLASGGLGLHVLRDDRNRLDVFGGLGYTSDRYIDPMVIDGRNRSRYGYLSALLGEESSHKLSDTTSVKQKLVLVPNLKNRGEFRADFDAALSVAMSKSLDLSVGFALQHNSEAGAGRKATDTLLTTGVSVKFD